MKGELEYMEPDNAFVKIEVEVIVHRANGNIEKVFITKDIEVYPNDMIDINGIKAGVKI